MRRNALPAALFTASDDGDARPSGGERLGHRPAKDTGAAKDDGNFLLEIEQAVHSSQPPQFDFCPFQAT